ncbi:hypothetical protein NHQ30_008203 [Ciborinia camelliae]|nr:hypothetical protein NHQ30_008203 [Ciborinia camelliae]
MASHLNKSDDSQMTAQRKPSGTGTANDDLCNLCLQALTIDDKLAGGAVIKASDGTTALDFSRFTFTNSWASQWVRGIRFSRCLDTHQDRDKPGWHGSKFNQDLNLCAGKNYERCVTLPTLLELSEPAAKRCRFCSRLKDLFCEQYDECSWWKKTCPRSRLRFKMQYEWQGYRKISEGDEEATITTTEATLDCLGVFVHHPGLKNYEVDFYKFGVEAWPGKCRDWLKIRTRPLDPDGPASKRNIDFMKHCIDECVKYHYACRDKLSNTQFIPTRLLDIGNVETLFVRLVERCQIPLVGSSSPQLQYATLSYCWGESLTLKTTEETKDEYEKIGILMHDMPATFQDAIYITRKLGIRYLWIDALCIIQHNTADWEAESVRMCDIFANSQITISAAANSSSSESFLQRPFDKPLDIHFRSLLNPDVSGEYSIPLQPRSTSRAMNDVRHSKLYSRAWVWQEEIMSTRQLVFGEKMFQFRCNQGISLENGLFEDSPGVILKKSSNYDWFWRNALRIYSSRELSYPRDRLGAMAGVAKFIDNNLKAAGKSTDYLVGLWLNDSFGYQICWACKNPTVSYITMMDSLRNENEYFAPSWSWASRNTGIHCYFTGDYTAVQVISYNLQPANSDAMVAVKFGSSITLRGKCRQTPVEPSRGRLKQGGNRESHRWETFSDHGRIDFWLDWVPNVDDPEEFKVQSQLQLLIINRSGEPSGLLILPFDGSHGTLYHRVGVFTLWGNSEWLRCLPDRDFTIW